MADDSGMIINMWKRKWRLQTPGELQVSCELYFVH